MGKVAKSLIRYVALFGWGVCMAAAAASVGDLPVAAASILLAYAFAFLGLDSGEQVFARIRRAFNFGSPVSTN